MDKGRSKYTSGGFRRQGTEVHADRRTKRRRTRADEERYELEIDQDLWTFRPEIQDILDRWPTDVDEEPAPRRRRR